VEVDAAADGNEVDENEPNPALLAGAKLNVLDAADEFAPNDIGANENDDEVALEEAILLGLLLSLPNADTTVGDENRNAD
jgi:hypothetical protein